MGSKQNKKAKSTPNRLGFVSAKTSGAVSLQGKRGEELPEVRDKPASVEEIEKKLKEVFGKSPANEKRSQEVEDAVKRVEEDDQTTEEQEEALAAVAEIGQELQPEEGRFEKLANMLTQPGQNMKIKFIDTDLTPEKTEAAIRDAEASEEEILEKATGDVKPEDKPGLAKASPAFEEVEAKAQASKEDEAKAIEENSRPAKKEEEDTEK